jgi:N-dimethylarginine dimethylaminohydrolase
MTILDEVSPLRDVLVKHPRAAFGDADRIAREWRALNFVAPPDFSQACREYDAFTGLLEQSGARLHFLPAASDLTIDSIYTRDASLVAPGGMVLAAMGKPARQGEPAAQQQGLAALTPVVGQINVVGQIEAPGRLEGGDVVWFDARTVAVGLGYRTNQIGADQYARLCGPDVTCLRVPLPHWKGPADVFHLMSMISPVDHDLAVVYAPLLPVFFRNFLLDRGYRLVEVPDEEFESMGANVLAVSPGRCVVLGGSPATRRRLESAGAEVLSYEGREISVKGGGGPTCLTRPLVRATRPQVGSPSNQNSNRVDSSTQSA